MSERPARGSCQSRTVCCGVSVLRTIYDEHAGVRDRFAARHRDPELAKRLGLIGRRAGDGRLRLRVDLPCSRTRLAVCSAGATRGDVAARVAVRSRAARIGSGRDECETPAARRVARGRSGAGGCLGRYRDGGWRGPVMMRSGPGRRAMWGVARSVMAELAVLGRDHRQHRWTPPINKSFNLPQRTTCSHVSSARSARSGSSPNQRRPPTTPYAFPSACTRRFAASSAARCAFARSTRARATVASSRSMRSTTPSTTSRGWASNLSRARATRISSSSPDRSRATWSSH